MFNGEELLRFVDQATWGRSTNTKGNCLPTHRLKHEELAKRVDALIVTHAPRLMIYSKLPKCVSPRNAGCGERSQGCGDAYRAGLIYD